MTTHDRYGHYVPVYDAIDGSRIPVQLEFDMNWTLGKLTAAGYARESVYITRELQFLVAVGPIWDIPDSILVKFDSTEAVTKEAVRLTVDLWETVVGKFIEFEARFRGGDSTITSETYTEMRRRMERVEEAWERLGVKTIHYEGSQC